MRDARHLRIKRRVAFSEAEISFIKQIVRQNAGERCRKRNVFDVLNTRARVIVLTESLILRFVLNAGDTARIVTEAHRHLLTFRYQMIVSQRVIGRRVGNRENSL